MLKKGFPIALAAILFVLSLALRSAAEVRFEAVRSDEERFYLPPSTWLRFFCLGYTEAMADADGNAMTPEQMGMPPGTPTETSIVVELVDFVDRTKMTMTHHGVPADSPGGQGWAMAIDKMESLLAT